MSSQVVPTLGLNSAQVREVSSTLSYYISRHLLPAFVLESLIFGVVSVAVLVGGYPIWRSGHIFAPTAVLRAIIIGSIYALLVSHWALAYSALTALRPWAEAHTSLYDLYLIMYTYETVLFGALMVVFLYASYLFLRKGGLIFRNMRLLLPFLAVIIVFVSAALHWAVGVPIWISSCTLGSLPCDWSNFSAGYQSTIVNITLAISILLGDGVVLWRACTVWLNHRYMIRLSCILLVPIVGCIFSNIITLNSPTEGIDATPDPFENGFGLAALCVSLLSNAFATAAIGYKAWLHRREVRQYLIYGSRRLLTEKILLLFVESGVLYICLWIFYFALNGITLFRHPASKSYGVMASTYQNGIIQLIAIYPTTVVILATLESQVHDGQDFAERPTSSQFIPAPVTLATMFRSASSDIIVIGSDNIREMGIETETIRTTPREEEFKIASNHPNEGPSELQVRSTPQ